MNDIRRRDTEGPTTGGSAPGAVRLEGVTLRYEGRHRTVTALEDVSLTIPAGEFISIVGPSGCGKSTLLSSVVGLLPPAGGRVEVGGEPVSGIRTDVGFIFQRDALLPWRTALQNVALPLKARGVNRSDARERAMEWIQRVGLEAFANTYPHQLSGGMRKRVQIAATMVYEPTVLLMDEPFAALDVQTRNLMENDLLKIWSENGQQTVVFVTHDLEEAIGLSDRVIVLTAGPGRVIGDYHVDLERPRDLTEVRFDPDFTELYHRLWEDLRGEVLRTYFSSDKLHGDQVEAD